MEILAFSTKVSVNTTAFIDITPEDLLKLFMGGKIKIRTRKATGQPETQYDIVVGVILDKFKSIELERLKAVLKVLLEDRDNQIKFIDREQCNWCGKILELKMPMASSKVGKALAAYHAEQRQHLQTCPKKPKPCHVHEEDCAKLGCICPRCNREVGLCICKDFKHIGRQVITND